MLKKKIWKKLLTLFFIPGILFFFCSTSVLAQSHSVAPHDTLFLIAQRYGTTVDQLSRANSIANPHLIYPGQVLAIPARVHNVLPGETLWLISQKYGVALTALIAANPALSPHNIYPGQKVNIPGSAGSGANTDAPVGGTLPSRGGRGFSPGEIDLLARLVHSEAGSEPYTGQVAVASSVLNRLTSTRYPSTLPGVIYQIIDGCYQYSPVLDGRINLPANNTAYQAVYDAINGWDPSLNALGFYNPAKTSNQWVRQQQVTTVIGNHIFFR
ncbi:MAG: LysM peptidoglycan-binding domain-containing protein [Firmicutes bacterium]|mgnify:CR=1 FL=1|nr:LysM peptidoglycan-binding domain-containing protein [Bacillota bacterium]